MYLQLMCGGLTQRSSGCWLASASCIRRSACRRSTAPTLRGRPGRRASLRDLGRRYSVVAFVAVRVIRDPARCRCHLLLRGLPARVFLSAHLLLRSALFVVRFPPCAVVLRSRPWTAPFGTAPLSGLLFQRVQGPWE